MTVWNYSSVSWIYTLLSHTSQSKHFQQQILQSQHRLHLMRFGLPQRLLPRPAARHLSSPSPPRTSSGCSAPVWSWPDVSAERIRDTGGDAHTCNEKNTLWNKEILWVMMFHEHWLNFPSTLPQDKILCHKPQMINQQKIWLTSLQQWHIRAVCFSQELLCSRQKPWRTLGD